MSECAASDRMASDPVSTPATALAPVSPADAAIDPSATRCLTSCIGAAPCRARVAGGEERVNATAALAQVFHDWLGRLRIWHIAFERKIASLPRRCDRGARNKRADNRRQNEIPGISPGASPY